MDALQIQKSLKAKGYDPGPIDGKRGRLTVAAIKRFQADHGAAVDGVVGPVTEALLRGGHKPRSAAASRRSSSMPWYDEALRLKGTKEAAGAADSPTILDWAKRLGIAYAHDATAWCGLFVAHCIGDTLSGEQLPANPLGARNWLKFGVETEPRVGAVMVFWRGSRSGWSGHVGFYAGEDAQAYHILGGNQSDAVTIARVSKGRFLGARWPKTKADVQSSASVIQGGEASGGLSENEA